MSFERRKNECLSHLKDCGKLNLRLLIKIFSPLAALLRDSCLVILFIANPANMKKAFVAEETILYIPARHIRQIIIAKRQDVISGTMQGFEFPLKREDKASQ